MPLKDFIEGTVKLLGTETNEILVEQAKAFRNNPGPNESALVTQFNDEMIADLTAEMKKSPEAVEPGLTLYAATRHLERIADHATNIAEDVIYLIEGEIVKHRPEAIGNE